jgi:signal transduction histidine kinase
LVITRQLVEAMNGQLRVESAPGEGSCFTIVLPRACANAATQDSIESADKG